MLHIKNDKSMSFSAGVDDENDSQVKTVGDLIRKMRRQSIFRKKF